MLICRGKWACCIPKAFERAMSSHGRPLLVARNPGVRSGLHRRGRMDNRERTHWDYVVSVVEKLDRAEEDACVVRLHT